MAATFSWFQAVSSVGNATTPGATTIMATSSAAAMSWDFETADNTGTTTYTANPVSAGSASYPVWLKGYWTNSVAYTVSNLRFWSFDPAASSANTNSFTILGTAQTKYSQGTSTATSSAWASNVALPSGVNSTTMPAGALGTGSSGALLGSFGSNAAASGVSGGNTATGSFIALQLSANGTAAAGTTGYFGFTMQYDEQ